MNEITNPNQEGVLTESREREREREEAESNQNVRKREKAPKAKSTKDLWRRVHHA